MNSNSPHVFFSGGGTAGHLFPGLAVAERLVEQVPGVEITFTGGGKPLERRAVVAAGFDYLAIPCRAAPGRLMETYGSLIENIAGYMVARRVLRDEHGALVVGLGGYASVPMAKAAAKGGVPLILLEQNAIPGKATRWLAKSATLVCAAFEQIKQSLPASSRVRVTGNPLRRGFERFAADVRPTPVVPIVDRRQVLVLGGSSGARSLNESVPRALYKIREQLAGWRVVHQTGPADVEMTRSLYAKFAIEAHVEAFFADIPQTLETSGLAVCRAGGTTLAELAAARVPAVLVPYPHAADEHQQRNAQVLARAGACVALDERKLSGRLDEHLAKIVCQFLEDPAQRNEKSAAIASFARPHAAQEVAAIIREVIASRTR